MATRHFDERAAPPDDGGELGSFNTPQHSMLFPSEADDHPDPAYIQRSDALRRGTRSRGMPYTIVFGLIALLIVLGYCTIPR